MLGEENHGAELGSDFPDEACVGGEPGDVALVAAVEEDGTQSIGAHPVLRADEVPLRESRILREAEVIEALREVPGFVSDLLCFSRELSEEAWGPFGRW